MSGGAEPPNNPRLTGQCWLALKIDGGASQPITLPYRCYKQGPKSLSWLRAHVAQKGGQSGPDPAADTTG